MKKVCTFLTTFHDFIQYLNHGILKENHFGTHPCLISKKMAKANFSQLISNSEKPILIDFHATWCGPCKSLAPIIQEFAQRNGSVKVIKIDVDKNPQIASKYGIQGVPTLILFKDGLNIWRKSGMMPLAALEREVRAALKS